LYIKIFLILRNDIEEIIKPDQKYVRFQETSKYSGKTVFGDGSFFYGMIYISNPENINGLNDD
jgi:hypothetical protein